MFTAYFTTDWKAYQFGIALDIRSQSVQFGFGPWLVEVYYN